MKCGRVHSQENITFCNMVSWKSVQILGLSTKCHKFPFPICDWHSTVCGSGHLPQLHDSFIAICKFWPCVLPLSRELWSSWFIASCEDVAKCDTEKLFNYWCLGACIFLPQMTCWITRTLAHSILVARTRQIGWDEGTTKWVKNRLDRWTQSVEGNIPKSNG